MTRRGVPEAGQGAGLRKVEGVALGCPREAQVLCERLEGEAVP